MYFWVFNSTHSLTHPLTHPLYIHIRPHCKIILIVLLSGSSLMLIESVNSITDWAGCGVEHSLLSVLTVRGVCYWVGDA